uniref:Uncharacterized protein n=1 Tax=Anguilla anguilla TaxID=7936 RepID=A0A0E9PQJ0_ANGAN
MVGQDAAIIPAPVNVAVCKGPAATPIHSSNLSQA